MYKDMVCVNGEVLPLAEASLPLGDRAWQFGDGVYECVPVYNGKCFALLPHMEALFASTIALKMPGIYTVEELVEFHEDLIKETCLINGTIYTQISRGVGKGSLEFPEMIVPMLTMFALEEGPHSFAEQQEEGVNIITVDDERWGRSDLGTLNRLPEVLAKQKATISRAFEAAFLREGKFTDATGGNFCIVKDGLIWTHPADHHIHASVARRLLKERLAVDLGLPVVEKAFTKEFALAAEEAFLIGDGYEVVPVVKIDRDFLGERKVGEVTLAIAQAYKKFVARECPLRRARRNEE